MPINEAMKWPTNKEQYDRNYNLIFGSKEKNMSLNKEIENMRKFASGATRDTNIGKLDFEGFFSPIVLERYAQYLHKHRVQSDGKLRDADNWQKGIPIETYMKSKVRHLIYTWLLHRGFPAIDDKGNEVDLEDSLCAEIFNSMGMLFELLKEKQNES